MATAHATHKRRIETIPIGVFSGVVGVSGVFGVFGVFGVVGSRLFSRFVSFFVSKSRRSVSIMGRRKNEKAPAAAPHTASCAYPRNAVVGARDRAVMPKTARELEVVGNAIHAGARDAVAIAVEVGADPNAVRDPNVVFVTRPAESRQTRAAGARRSAPVQHAAGATTRYALATRRRTSHAASEETTNVVAARSVQSADVEGGRCDAEG